MFLSYNEWSKSIAKKQDLIVELPEDVQCLLSFY